MKHEINVILILFAGLLTMVSGCSVNRTTPLFTSPANIPYSLKDTKDASWWSYKFKNVWPDNKSPVGELDLFLAHAVVAPVLARHVTDIPYWRFHRRAARDEAGHRFSFLFYSKPDVAFQIFEEIDKNSFLKKAMTENYVEKVSLDDYDYPHPSSIEDTSDINWSPELQRNWPSFIMGVSSLWLGLINEYVTLNPNDSENISTLLEKYQEAQKRITGIWRNEGQHALLHHLNAIFGYSPMLIRKEIQF